MLLPIEINSKLLNQRNKSKTLYHLIRDAILNGIIPENFPMPSTREFAKNYLISRLTVVNVYEKLRNEGYINSKIGSGYFVIKINLTSTNDKTKRKNFAPHDGSNNSSKVKKENKTLSRVKNKIDFGLKRININSFPTSGWRKAIHDGFRMANREIEESIPTEGFLEFRQSIASHLKYSRGIHVNPENIVIVNGSQQAISLLCYLLLTNKDSVLLENPSYMGTSKVIDLIGSKKIILPVDQNGLKTDLLKSILKCKLAFVSPSRQFPTGASMPLNRRYELLQWAKINSTFIVEDDYDVDFFRKGKVIEPLKMIDKNEQVIYLGSFSRTISFSIRIGYIILPSSLLQNFIKLKYIFEPYSSSLMEQFAITSFMQTGLYGKHLRKLNRIYQDRYEYFTSLLNQKLPDVFLWYPNSGLHLFAFWKKEKKLYELFFNECFSKGLILKKANEYFFTKPSLAFIFGYSQLDKNSLQHIVELMEETYKKLIISI